MSLWGVQVYHDYMDPDQCEVMSYHFENEKIAKEFRIQAVETYDTIFISPLSIIPPSSVSVSNNRFFYHVQEALDDLCFFLDRENRCKYIYQNEICQMPLICLHYLIYQSECVYLEEENRNLKSQLQNMKKKYID